MRKAACLMLVVGRCNTGIEQMGDVESERPRWTVELKLR